LERLLQWPRPPHHCSPPLQPPGKLIFKYISYLTEIFC
jgi:hypothetical protein